MNEPLRVLVVDDQRRARHGLKALLSTWPRVGEVYEAANGLQCLARLEECRPDLVLMDARMPKLDGIETARLIKARRQQVKVVIMSMFEDYSSEALAAGADAFLNKANLLDRLMEVLNTLFPGGETASDR